MPSLTKLALAVAALHVLWWQQAFAAPAPAAAAAVAAEDVMVVEGDVVGGVRSQPGAFPFIVALTVKDKEGRNQAFCGGVLINANTVLTAAHVSHHSVPSDFTVRAGSLSWNSSVATSGVTRFLIHPLNNYYPPDNDIALWQLSSPIHECSSIGYATLPPQSPNLPPIGTEVTVAGWGVDAYDKDGNGTSPLYLRQASLPVAPTETCQAAYDAQGFPVNITSSMFCAGDHSGRHGETCAGDSGGPVVDTKIKGLLWGLASIGPEPCGGPDYYDTYVRVSKFVDWIEKNKF